MQQGHKENQEDALFPSMGEATDQTRIFLVCDGIGGHEKGEVASNCVASVIGNYVSTRPVGTTADMKAVFEAGLAEAYRQLDALEPNAKGMRTMGTTLTFLALCDDGVFIAHIGDSRVYHMRPGQGILLRTRDHSLVFDLIAAGELTEEEARTYPQRNVITRAVQPHQEYPSRATYDIVTDVQPGDVFFLCSDGVIEQIEDVELQQYLLDARYPLAERVGQLATLCTQRSTRDNNTCYAIEMVGRPAEGGQKHGVTVAAGPASKPSRPEACSRKRPFPPLIWIGLLLIVIGIAGSLCFLYLQEKPQPGPSPKETVRKSAKEGKGAELLQEYGEKSKDYLPQGEADTDSVANELRKVKENMRKGLPK